MSLPALRQIASGVSVLTVNHNGVRRGTTVSTLTAVSRNPPILSVCLRAESVINDLTAAGGLLGVSVLRADQAQLARDFADPLHQAGAGKFDRAPWRTVRAEPPLLRDAVARFICTLATRVSVGDHHVLLARVRNADTAPGTPLLSFAGELHALSAPPPGPDTHPPGTAPPTGTHASATARTRLPEETHS